ncbi:hypothetical protein ACKJL9_06350 [Legionella pneumophila]|uniref:hypothetical protein n=1 Tax=Legionella pneumophila TaxID=446 RepID=UPI003987FB69
MIDKETKTLFEEIQKKANKMTSRYGEMIEEKIKRVIIESDCKPSDIVIEVHCQTRYRILVKKDEWELNDCFILGGNND